MSVFTMFHAHRPPRRSGDKLYHLIILALLLALRHSEALGQPAALVPAAWHELTLDPTSGSGIEHTGADYWEDSNGNRLRVACWDGTTPSLGWAYSTSSWSSPAGSLAIEVVAPGDYLDGKVVSSASLLARDPDIVVWENSQHGWFITLTFLQEVNGRDQVLQSIYTYEPGSNQVKLVKDPSSPAAHYPQLVSSMTGNTKCATPNVDVGRDGSLVFVYEDESEGEIFARLRTISTLSDAYPTAAQPSIVQISHPNPAACYSDEENFSNIHPDVAVWEDSRSGLRDAATVHISFIQQSYPAYASPPFNRRVLVMSTEVSNLALTGWQPTCQLYTLAHAPYINSDDNSERIFPTYPRIAPVYNSIDPAAYAREDWAMVWGSRVVDGPLVTHEITTATYRASLGSIANGDINFNKRNTTPCLHTEPAIGHYFDDQYVCNGTVDGTAVCTWTYSGGCMTGTTRSGSEIIGQPIRMDANDFCFQPKHEYMQVNQEYAQNQYAPSVSGGHGSADPQTSLNQILFVWVTDDNNGMIQYKEAAPFPSNNPLINYRITASTPSVPTIAVVPNPANGASVLQLMLSPGETLESLRVIDVLLNQPTVQWDTKALQTFSEETKTTDVSLRLDHILKPGQQPGLFVARIQTSQGVRTVRFSYQP